MEQRTHSSISNYLRASIRTLCQVKIWRVDNPHRIWVSPEHPKGHREATLQLLRSYRPEQPGLHKLLEEGLYPGAPVFWWSGQEEGFHRAVCLEDCQDPTRVNIYNGDWGWIKTAHLEDLFYLPFVLRGEPWTLICCGLAGIQPIGGQWTTRANEELRQLIGRTLWMTVDHADANTDAVWVDMVYVHEYRRNVGMELVEKGLAEYATLREPQFQWGKTGGAYCDRVWHNNYEAHVTAPPRSPPGSPPRTTGYDSEATTEIFVPSPRIRVRRSFAARRRRGMVRRVLQFVRTCDSDSEPEWFRGREHSDGE